MSQGNIHEDLRRLVGLLPERQAVIIKQLVEMLIEDTEEDTEPLTAEERAALERGREQAARGETVKLEALAKELGREV